MGDTVGALTGVCFVIRDTKIANFWKKKTFDLHQVIIREDYDDEEEEIIYVTDSEEDEDEDESAKLKRRCLSFFSSLQTVEKDKLERLSFFE